MDGKDKTSVVPENEDKTQDWDKTRQQADIERANAEKARAEVARTKSELEEARQQLAEQKQQLEALNAKESATKSVDELIPDLNDDDITFESLAASLRSSKQLIKSQAEQIAELKNTASRYQQSKAQEEAKKSAEALLNKVCSEFDEEFGAGLRNDAIRLMEQKTKENGPVYGAEAVLRLRSCYREVAKTKKKDTPKPNSQIKTDTGGGGGRPSIGEAKIKKGSLKDVSAQLRKQS